MQFDEDALDDAIMSAFLLIEAEARRRRADELLKPVPEGTPVSLYEGWKDRVN